VQVLRWFWLLVGAMHEEQRCALLRFWTSLPCLPEGGFASCHASCASSAQTCRASRCQW